MKSQEQKVQGKLAPRPMLDPLPETVLEDGLEVEAWSLASEFVEPGTRHRGNGGPPKIAQHEHAAFLLDRIVTNYERSLEKPVNRGKVTALWETLTANEQQAAAEGFLVWLMEQTVKPGDDGYDPKFVKSLDKLFEEGMLKRKITSLGVDRHGAPLADIRPKILGAWLTGSTFGAGQI